jgi:hypothetical protein
MKFSKYFFILFLLIFAGCKGSPEPISLPVPFSGFLTDSGTLGIAEGKPVGGGILSAQSLITKNQFQSDLSITWLVFDPNTGKERGTVTFFPNTVDIKEIINLPNGENRRIFTMKVSTLMDGVESTSSNMQCFDFQTTYPTNFTAADCNGNPNGTPVIRKIACSGNDDMTGVLLDGKFLAGMIQDSSKAGTAEEFQFCTQQESFVFNRNLPFFQVQGTPQGNVVFTMLLDGGAQPVPGEFNAVTTDLLIPGSNEVVGQVKVTFFGGPPDNFEQFTSVSDEEFTLGNSRLVTHNCKTILNHVPELAQVIRESAGRKFPDYFGTPELMESGEVFFNSIEKSECEPINCDPAAGEATEMFQDLCRNFGPLRVNFLCFILSTESTESLTPFIFLNSVWEIVRDHQ